MNVVVQNGAEHCLSRAEVEAMVPSFPHSWNRFVGTILLAGGGTELVASFHEKEKVLSVQSPPRTSAASDKVAAVGELLIALAAISELGQLPKRLSKSHRHNFERATQELLEQCTLKLR